MTHLGYVLGGYLLTAAVLGGYVLRLRSRSRAVARFAGPPAAPPVASDPTGTRAAATDSATAEPPAPAGEPTT